MRTNVRVNALTDNELPERPWTEKGTAAPRKLAAPLYAQVKTIDDWNAWMRARGRYQPEPED